MTQTRLFGTRLMTVAALALCVWLGVSLRRETPPKPLAIRTGASPARTIRVSLNSGSVSKLTVEVNGPYRLYQAGSGQVLFQAKRLSPATVVAKGRNLQLGDREFAVSQLDIVPLNSGLVWCNGHAYRGTLRIYRLTSGSLIAVNHVPLEHYIASVVNSEMPAEFGVEARKAQAIVSRSFALWQMQSASLGDRFDLYASTRSQRYLGYQYRGAGGRLLAGESAESRQIAEETAGQICTYRGKLFCAYYSATCGGRTMLGTEFFPEAAPVHQSVSCEWCQAAPRYRWTAALPRRTVEERLRAHFSKKGGKFGTLQTIGPAGPVQPGRVPQFAVRDDTGTRQISGLTLRILLGNEKLYSSRFAVETGMKTILFRGQGYGHGVGLCQWGARGQAHGGRTASEIVAYYYPGSKIVSLDTK